MAINFPLRTAFAVPIGSDRLYFHSLNSRNFLIFSMIHQWLSNVLFSPQLFVDFLLLLLLLSSSFIALWSDRMQGGYFNFFIFAETFFVP
jgi:hypothetical protein